MKTEQNNRFKVLGVNDDRDFCECCGRENLKKVVWIEDAETGKIQHFGVVCADNPAKAFGLKREIKNAIANFQFKQQVMWKKARAIYRVRGGAFESNGIPLAEGGAIICSDKALYAECLREAA